MQLLRSYRDQIMEIKHLWLEIRQRMTDVLLFQHIVTEVPRFPCLIRQNNFFMWINRLVDCANFMRQLVGKQHECVVGGHKLPHSWNSRGSSFFLFGRKS